MRVKPVEAFIVIAALLGLGKAAQNKLSVDRPQVGAYQPDFGPIEKEACRLGEMQNAHDEEMRIRDEQARAEEIAIRDAIRERRGKP